MNRNCVWVLGARTADGKTRERVASAHSGSSRVRPSLSVFLLGFLPLSSSCSSVQSSVEASITGGTPTQPTPGDNIFRSLLTQR